MNKKDILHILNDIEKTEGIEILFACETGSRIWGFSNEESDYDIRFIYKNTSLTDYLSIKNIRDVIEIKGDNLDIVGWDIRKALKLHYKSNPSLREWLMSPQVYIDKGISSIFKDLGGFDRNILKNYYYTMALNHWKRYSSLKFGHEKIKKYLYVIRCILTWKLLNKNLCPPININDLMNHEKSDIPKYIKEIVLNLMDFSHITEEDIFKVNNFILNSISSMDKVKVKSEKDLSSYDERFRELLLVFR